MGFFIRECIYQDSGLSIGGLIGWTRRRNKEGSASVAITDAVGDNPMVNRSTKETVIEMHQMRSLLSHSMKSDVSVGCAGEDWKENEIIGNHSLLLPGQTDQMIRMSQLEQLVTQQQNELRELREYHQKELNDMRALIQSLHAK